MEPIISLLRPTCMDLNDYDDQTENRDHVRLPDFVEEYLAQERAWWRFLRSAGAVDENESVKALQWWMSNP